LEGPAVTDAVTPATASVPTPSTLLAALRRAGPLAIAGLVANGSNVIVTVVIAHLLTSRGYGSLTQLVAMFLVLSMPGSALLVAVVRRVTAWDSAGQQQRTAEWVARVRRTAAVALIAWVILAVVVRDPLTHVLALPHPDGVTEVLVAGGGWALLSVERGLLQSRRAYGALARNLCVEAGVRTVLTVGLVAAGMGVEGAALALVGAMAAALADARLALHRARRSAGTYERKPGDSVAAHTDPVLPLAPGRRHLAADLATALGALGLLAALQNLDVLIVGRQSPGSVGAYGAISVASKAVVFGALVLSGYLLPEAVLRSHRGEHALRQLAVALGLVAIPVVVLAVLATIASRPLLRLAFGPDKTQAAPAFATLAVAMGCLAASVLFTHYLLGVGRRRVVGVLAAAAVVLVVAVARAHGHPAATARSELAVQTALALVLAGLVWRVPRRAAPARSAPVTA
jgi:O-antigen/teichoic acid export membrane protein